MSDNDRGRRAHRNLDRANAALAEKRRKLTFRSVRHAMRWYAETYPRRQSAHGLHPRTEQVDDFGTRVPMHDIDGGPGGDLDEVLATLATITAALDRLRVYNPRLHLVVISIAAGESQESIGRSIGQSQRIVSYMLGKAEAFLAGRLGDVDGVLRFS
jgi:hypothetical protein